MQGTAAGIAPYCRKAGPSPGSLLKSSLKSSLKPVIRTPPAISRNAYPSPISPDLSPEGVVLFGPAEEVGDLDGLAVLAADGAGPDAENLMNA
jgi:hypothetical protein